MDGLGALVRLAAYHPQVIGPDLEKVVRLLMVEYKSPRSQVARAALQVGFIFEQEMCNSLIIYGNPYR